MDIPGIGPAGAARILADVGDIARFADRNRFASWTGTAPLDASSGEQIRHRLSRAGNRRMNHVAAHRRDRADPPRHRRPRLLPAQARRRQDPDGSAALPQTTPLRCHLPPPRRRPSQADVTRAREGTAGRLFNPARPTCPRTSTLRISHFPDPQTRRYDSTPRSGRTTRSSSLTQRGARSGCSERRSPSRDDQQPHDARRVHLPQLPRRPACRMVLIVVVHELNAAVSGRGDPMRASGPLHRVVGRLLQRLRELHRNPVRPKGSKNLSSALTRA